MSVVLLTVPAGRSKAKIDAAQPRLKTNNRGSGYSLIVPVRNRGNIHTRMDGSVEVRSEAGQKLERFELAAGRGFLLPGHERLFRSKGELNLPDGLYVARVRLVPEKFRRPMQKEFAFHIRDGEPSFGEVSEELRNKMRRQTAGFAVSPPKLAVRARAGSRRMQAVKLINLTDESLRLKAHVLEWTRTADARDLVMEKEPPHGRSAAGGLKLRTKELTLRPRGRRRVPLTVALPRDMEGERYAAVCFDRTDLKLEASPAGRARRSALVRVLSQGTGKTSAEIAEFTATRLANGAVNLEVRLKNSGNLTVQPDARFYIDDEHGDAAGRIAPGTRPSPILAGGEGVVSALWDKVLDPGEYTARVSLRYSPQEPPLTARTGLVIPSAQTARTTEK
jgi:hypothetical protein